MASIVYKSLSSLSPIELKYQYHRDEKLDTSFNEYDEGYSFYETEGLNNFQDIVINKDSCFVLTSAVNLEEIFISNGSIDLNEQPSTVILQPQDSFIYFVRYNPLTNTLQKTLTSSSHFFIQPIEDTKEVELFVDGKYVQVDEEYPFTLRLNSRSLDPEIIHRQRFSLFFENGLISFKTKTQDGYRYLAFNSDNTMRAVGVIFNDSVVNSYLFKCYPITDITTAPGFIPTNNWVTYYFDVESQVENKTVTVNKDIQKVPTNLLIDFPVEAAVESGKAKINIANLKTQVTPTGGPAPIDNSYNKQVITKN